MPTKKYGHGLRSLVESKISRIKRSIGATLLTQKGDSQQSGGIFIANIIDPWNSSGSPISITSA